MKRLVLVAMLPACSWLGPSRVPDDVDRGLEAASTMEDDHQYAIARDQIEAVAALAGEPRAAELRMRACRTYALEGNDAASRSCFAAAQRELQNAPIPKDVDDVADAKELEGRAALATADTHDALEQVIVSYPGTDAARRALIARLADVDGCPARIAILDRLEPRAPAALIRAFIATRRAELLLNGCHDTPEALIAARHAEEVAIATHYLDDAIFVHAKAAEAAGVNDEALDAYKRIIATESSAWPFGSNDSLFLDDAWMAHGLLLEKLGRKKEAIATLEDLISARPESRFHDDADRAIARMRGK